MKNRKRKTFKSIYFSEEEWEIIEANMMRAGIHNFSAYARKMLCDGYVIKLDFSTLKTSVRDIGGIARNINQIAKRANETRSIYAADVNELKVLYSNLKTEHCKFIMSEIRRLGRIP